MLNDALNWMRITTLCREFHVLPEPGGLLSQRMLHVKKMECVMRAQAKHEEFERK